MTGWSRSRSAHHHHVAADTCFWKGMDLSYPEHPSTSSTTPGHVDFTIEANARCACSTVRAWFTTRSGSAAPVRDGMAQANSTGLPGSRHQQDGPRRCQLLQFYEHIRNRLKGNPVPIQIPLGAEDTFAGVIDLVTMEAIYWDDASRE